MTIVWAISDLSVWQVKNISGTFRVKIFRRLTANKISGLLTMAPQLPSAAACRKVHYACGRGDLDNPIRSSIWCDWARYSFGVPHHQVRHILFNGSQGPGHNLEYISKPLQPKPVLCLSVRSFVNTTE